jgi:hypothetical protein
MKLFALFYLTFQAFSAGSTFMKMQCFLLKPGQKTRLVVNADFNRPVDVIGDLRIPFTAGLTAQIDVNFEGEVIVSNAEAKCARYDSSQDNVLACTWEPRSVSNGMPSVLRVIPDLENGQFTGGYAGFAFIANYGLYGLDSRDLVISFDESMACETR